MQEMKVGDITENYIEGKEYSYLERIIRTHTGWMVVMFLNSNTITSTFVPDILRVNAQVQNY